MTNTDNTPTPESGGPGAGAQPHSDLQQGRMPAAGRASVRIQTAAPAPAGRYDFGDILNLAISEKASDIHIRPGEPPIFRIHGELVRAEGGARMDATTAAELIAAFTPESKIMEVKENGSADFSFARRGDGIDARFRCNVFKSGEGGMSAVLRSIPTKIQTLEELGVPASIQQFLELPRGLVLVTGPTGSGKSTTLAAMVDQINRTSSHAHILTIEDPIEFYHTSKKAVITQRAVDVDCKDFASGLRAGLRQDPDVILVGELRDLETMEAAIRAAETGHLVFGTLHTTGAAKTVDRIVSAFPEKARDNIRIQLSTSLAGVVSQLLLPNIDGKGRTAAFEVMVSTPAVAAGIKRNDAPGIANAIQTGSKFGMLSMDDSLMAAIESGKVNPAVALTKAVDRVTLESRILEWQRAQSGGAH